jgi:hypothetical protein
LLVVFGPPRDRWPDPLPPLLTEGRLAMTAFPTAYGVAAAVVGAEARVAAIIVNLGNLGRVTVEALRTLQLATGLPVIVPPQSASLGFSTAWEAVAWETLTSGGSAAEEAVDGGENVVTDDIQARYDEIGMQPILSEQEIRALLGAPD